MLSPVRSAADLRTFSAFSPHDMHNDQLALILGLGFRVEVLGFRSQVSGVEFRVSGTGVYLQARCEAAERLVSSTCLRRLSSEWLVLGVGFRVSDVGCRVWGVGCKVEGVGCRV